MQIALEAAYGLADNHLVMLQGHAAAHRLEPATATALTQMTTAAKKAGFELRLCSGYRNFARQLHIFNAKARGHRPVRDKNSQIVDISHKTDDERLDLILLWSALPGCSRHHWGTDIDVYDAGTIELKQLNLVTEEYTATGPCAKLHAWLELHAPNFGFYFPFQAGLSGVSPEPWHLSYFPIASTILASFELAPLQQLIQDSDIELKETILARLELLVEEYVFRVVPVPEMLPNT